MQKITPFLWFDDKAGEAANFYTSVFKNSKIISTSYYETDTPSGFPKGTVMTVAFEIDGQPFTALNGGPVFKFTEAISFVVNCEDQKEIDYLWEKLSADPQGGQCGWTKDKYGVSWQIIPKNLGELINNEKGMQAMLKMKKLVIADLQKANEVE